MHTLHDPPKNKNKIKEYTFYFILVNNTRNFRLLGRYNF